MTAVDANRRKKTRECRRRLYRFPDWHCIEAVLAERHGAARIEIRRDDVEPGGELPEVVAATRCREQRSEEAVDRALTENSCGNRTSQQRERACDRAPM